MTELVLSEKGKNPSVSIDKIVKLVQAKDPLFTRERISYRGTAMLRYDMLRDDRTDGGDRRAASRNVLGEPLEICSLKPMTGFYRDGCCDTGREDFGSHTVCVVLIPDFLEFSKSRGNDLSTPMPEFGFPGLKPGDHPAVAQAGDLWLQHFVGEEIEQAAHSTHPRGLCDGGEESIRLLGFIVGFAPGA